jgi:anti-sigma factor RsiW
MERNQHIEHLIPQYTLELLSKKESKAVSDHLEVCTDCRATLKSERQMVVDIRDSITAAVAHDNKRLQELMPPLPAAKDKILDNFGWQRQLAVVGFLLILVFGSLALQRGLTTKIFVSRAPIIQPTTILATDTPTQTSVATRFESSSSPVIEPTPISNDMIMLPKPALAPVPTSPLLH